MREKNLEIDALSFCTGFCICSGDIAIVFPSWHYASFLCKCTGGYFGKHLLWNSNEPDAYGHISLVSNCGDDVGRGKDYVFVWTCVSFVGAFNVYGFSDAASFSQPVSGNQGSTQGAVYAGIGYIFFYEMQAVWKRAVHPGFMVFRECH